MYRYVLCLLRYYNEYKRHITLNIMLELMEVYLFSAYYRLTCGAARYGLNYLVLLELSLIFNYLASILNTIFVY